MERTCFECRVRKLTTLCSCGRAHFCSAACRDLSVAHLALCADLKDKTRDDETTAILISKWLQKLVNSENSYTNNVRASLAKKDATSFLDFVAMSEDEIAFLFSSQLAIARISLREMPSCLAKIEKEDPIRVNYVELYRTLLSDKKARAFLELRIFFGGTKLRLFRQEILEVVK